MIKMFIRYSIAIVWIAILAAFSYGELIFNYIRVDGIGFENKLIDIHSSYAMLLVNMGLVFMLYVDRYITYLTSKHRSPSMHIEFLLFINMVIASTMTFLAFKMKEGFVLKVNLLPCLFIIYIAILIIYKAESILLNNAHNMSNGNMLKK
jgi:hypothetical protein